MQLAQLPVAPQEHRDVSGDGGGAELLVVVAGQHRTRRRAGADGVTQEREHADHPLAMRRLAEHRPPVRVHQLAALRPEHRQVIEDGRLPAARVVEVAVDAALLRDRAGRAQQLVPRRGRREAPGPCGSRGRGSRCRATGRRRCPAASESVSMVNGMKSARSSAGHSGSSGCTCPPSGTAASRSCPPTRRRAAVRRRRQQQLGLVQLERRHHRDLEPHVRPRARPLREDVVERLRDAAAARPGASSRAAPTS